MEWHKHARGQSYGFKDCTLYTDHPVLPFSLFWRISADEGSLYGDCTFPVKQLKYVLNELTPGLMAVVSLGEDATVGIPGEWVDMLLENYKTVTA